MLGILVVIHTDDHRYGFLWSALGEKLLFIGKAEQQGESLYWPHDLVCFETASSDDHKLLSRRMVVFLRRTTIKVRRIATKGYARNQACSVIPTAIRNLAG
jgi:hypothetical protein